MSMPETPPNGIVLIGPLPPPHGGVSTLVERLALAVPGVIRMIIDTGEGSSGAAGRREELSVDTRMLPKGLLLSWAAQWRHLRDVPPDAMVVVNVSHPQGVLRYLPAFARGLRTAVVLHHGTPFRRRGPMGATVEWLTRRIFRAAMDTVVCLNDAQARFVRNVYGVPDASIRFASSYVPVDLVLDHADRPVPPSNEIRVVASGEPRAYHHFDQLIDVWEAAGFGETAELTICLYGPKEAVLESALAAAAEATGGVRLLRDLDSWEFLDLLGTSDVYVRTSSVDAFGIAVADAVRLGLEVIATDVCERYPGCRLIPPEDWAALREALRAAIVSRRQAGHQGAPRLAGMPGSRTISLLDSLNIGYEDLVAAGDDEGR